MTAPIITVIIFLAMFIGWLKFQEKYAAFAPTGEMSGDPSGYGMSYEDVHFTSGDGTGLDGWFIPGTSSITVLWLHGNAGNISDRLDILRGFNHSLGVSSFIFDYRGYGKSEGRPSEKGLYEDARAAWEWLTEQRGVPPGNIILYGHSLGTAVAVDLALGAGGSAAGLALESPFTSARALARRMYGGIPVDLFMSLHFDNIGRVGGVKMPLLVIHGDKDATIPFEMGKEVFDAGREPKAFFPVPGGDHSDCYLVGGEAYWDAWRKLLNRVQSSSTCAQ